MNSLLLQFAPGLSSSTYVLGYKGVCCTQCSESVTFDKDPDPWILLFFSVADPGCLSRILIFTNPESRIQKQQH